MSRPRCGESSPRASIAARATASRTARPADRSCWSAVSRPACASAATPLSRSIISSHSRKKSKHSHSDLVLQSGARDRRSASITSDAHSVMSFRPLISAGATIAFVASDSHQGGLTCTSSLLQVEAMLCPPKRMHPCRSEDSRCPRFLLAPPYLDRYVSSTASCAPIHLPMRISHRTRRKGSNRDAPIPRCCAYGEASRSTIRFDKPESLHRRFRTWEGTVPSCMSQTMALCNSSRRWNQQKGTTRSGELRRFSAQWQSVWRDSMLYTSRPLC